MIRPEKPKLSGLAVKINRKLCVNKIPEDKFFNAVASERNT